jgi:hypothetical protein
MSSQLDLYNLLKNDEKPMSEEKREYYSDPYGFFLTAKEKENRVKEKLEQKKMNFSGYKKARVLEITDGDNIVLEDEEGNIYNKRITSDISPYFDAVETSHSAKDGLRQPTEVIKDSRYKSVLQPKMVSRITGKPEEELTDIDYLRVAEQNKETLSKAIIEGGNEEGLVWFKDKGKDTYGRGLVELVNPKTKTSISDKLASSMDNNASFDYKSIMSNILNPKEQEEAKTKLTKEEQYVVDYSNKLITTERQKRLENFVDSDGRFSENIDMMQSSGIQLFSNIAEAFVRLEAQRRDKHKHTTEGWLRKEDTRTPEEKQIDRLTEYNNTKNKADALSKTMFGKTLDQLQDSEITDRIAGVKYSTRLDHIHQTQKAYDLIDNGIKNGSLLDVMKGVATIAGNADRFIAESAPSSLLIGLGGPIGVGAFTFGQVNEIANNYKEKTGREMSPEDFVNAFMTRLPVTTMEHIFLKGVGKTAVGKQSVLKAFNDTSKGFIPRSFNIGKIISTGVGMEGLQEWTEGIHTSYWSGEEGTRSLKEAVTNFDNLFGGIVGGVTGGAMAGGGVVSGAVIKPLKDLVDSDKITERQKNKAIKIFKDVTSNMTYTGVPVNKEADLDIKVEVEALVELEIDNMTKEEAIAKYKDILDKRNTFISDISPDTNDEVANKLAMLKTKAYSDMTKEEIDTVYGSDEQATNRKKEDLEDIIFRTTNKVKKALRTKLEGGKIEDKNLNNIVDQLINISDKLDVDTNTLKKTMQEVDFEATYGIAGYKTYNDVLSTLNKKKEETKDNPELQANIDNQIAYTTDKINRFLTSQVDKLSQFTSGVESVVKDRTAENIELLNTNVEFNGGRSKFKINAGDIVNNNYDNLKGFYGVSKGIVNNITGILDTMSKNGIEIPVDIINQTKSNIKLIDTTIGEIKTVKGKPYSTTLESIISFPNISTKQKIKVKTKPKVKLEPKSNITRIISGGQTGGDMGGLKAGKALGIVTGGTAPKGWRVDGGTNPGLADYGLIEDDKSSYPSRTMKNVDSADATIAFLYGSSVGTAKTIGYAQTGKWQYGNGKTKIQDGHKPVLVITSKKTSEVVQQIKDFIKQTGATSLNIAGHRERTQPGIEKFVERVLIEALKPSKVEIKVKEKSYSIEKDIQNNKVYKVYNNNNMKEVIDNADKIDLSEYKGKDVKGIKTYLLNNGFTLQEDNENVLVKKAKEPEDKPNKPDDSDETNEPKEYKVYEEEVDNLKDYEDGVESTIVFNLNKDDYDSVKSNKAVIFTNKRKSVEFKVISDKVVGKDPDTGNPIVELVVAKQGTEQKSKPKTKTKTYKEVEAILLPETNEGLHKRLKRMLDWASHERNNEFLKFTNKIPVLVYIMNKGRKLSVPFKTNTGEITDIFWVRYGESGFFFKHKENNFSAVLAFEGWELYRRDAKNNKVELISDSEKKEIINKKEYGSIRGFLNTISKELVDDIENFENLKPDGSAMLGPNELFSNNITIEQERLSYKWGNTYKLEDFLNDFDKILDKKFTDLETINLSNYIVNYRNAIVSLLNRLGYTQSKTNDFVYTISTNKDDDSNNTNKKENKKRNKVLYKHGNISLEEGKDFIIDTNLKSIANAGKNNVIRLNPVTDIKAFFNYFLGKDKVESSKQKHQVLKRLEEYGYTETKLRSVLNSLDKINIFILLHEKDHIKHNDRDVYFKQGKSLLTEDKINIELRATVNALEQLTGIKTKRIKPKTNEPKLITPLIDPSVISKIREKNKDITNYFGSYNFGSKNVTPPYYRDLPIAKVSGVKAPILNYTYQGRNYIGVNANGRLLEDGFRKKIWRNPTIEGVLPLIKDFETVNKYTMYLLERAYQRATTLRGNNESNVDYANRLNKATLEALGYNTAEYIGSVDDIVKDFTKEVLKYGASIRDIVEEIKNIRTSTLETELNEETRNTIRELRNKKDKLIEEFQNYLIKYKKDNKDNVVINKILPSKPSFIKTIFKNDIQKLFVSDILTSKGKPTLLGTIPTVSNTGDSLSNRIILTINPELLAGEQTTEKGRRGEWVKSFTKSFINNEKDSIEDPARTLLFNNDGRTINNNVLKAITVSAKDFVINSYSLFNPITREDIGKVLGKQPEAVTKEDIKFVNKNGVFINYIADAIGKKVLDLLGLQYKDLGDGKYAGADSEYLYKKLVSHLGNMGILYLEDENIIQKNTVKASEMQLVMPNFGVVDSKEDYSGKQIIEIEAKTIKLINPRATLKLIQKERDSHNTMMELYDSSSFRERRPKAKPLKDISKLPNQNIRHSNGIFKVPSTIKEVLFNRRNKPFVANENLIKYVLTNKELVKKYLGYTDTIPKDVLYENKLGMEGKNVAITRAIDAIEDFYNSGLDMIYFDWFMSKNHRLFIDSNTINPIENSSLHRFLFTLKDNSANINLNKSNRNYKLHEEGFTTALCQAFGIDIEKILVKDRIRIGKAILNIKPDQVWKLVDNNKGNIKVLEKELEELIINSFHGNTKDKSIPTGIEIESFGHLLTGIKALEDYRNSKDGKFNTALKVEVDSKTNGFAIRLLQFPYPDIISVWGEKVGIFKGEVERKGKIEKVSKRRTERVFSDYAKEEDILDSYETLGESIDVDRIEVSGNKNTKEALNKYKEEWEAIKPLLPKSENGVVTKSLRKLVKNPFMIFNYASKVTGIKNKIASDISKEIMNNLIKLNNKAINELLEKELQVFKFGQSIRQVSIRNRVITVNPDLFNKTFQDIKVRGIALETLFKELIGNTYGQLVWDVMESKFSKFIELNSKITDAFKLMTREFKKEYFKERQNIINTVGLTQKRDIELVRSLLDKFPLIKTVYSDDFESSLGVYERERLFNFGSNTGSKFLNKDGTRGGWSVTPIQNTFGEAVSAGAVLFVHMLDGSNVFKMLMDKSFEKKSMFTIHDALLINPLQINSAPKAFNKYLYTINRDFNIFDNLLDSFKNTFKDKESLQIKDIKNINIAFKETTSLNLEYYTVHDKTKEANANKKDFFYIEEVIKDLEATANEINKVKEEFYKGDFTITNIAGGSKSYFRTGILNEYQAKIKKAGNDKDKVDNLLEEMNTKLKNNYQYYSDPITGSEEDVKKKMMELAKGSFGDINTRLNMLNTLEAMGTPLESEHKEILVSILKKLDNKDFKDIALKVFKGSNNSYGDADINTKAIKVTVGIDSEYNNPAVLYMHELIHAVAGTVLNNPIKYKADLEVAKLRELYNIASKHVKPEDFLPDFQHIPDEKLRLEKATIRYNYIFNNPDIAENRGIQEFLAYSMTNASLINKLKTIDRYDKKDTKNILQRILDIGFKIIDLFLGTAKFSEIKGNLHDSIVNTFYQIVRANEKSLFSIGSKNLGIEASIDYFYKALSVGDNFVKGLGSKLIKYIDDKTVIEARQENTTKFQDALFLAKAIPMTMFSNKYREVIPDILRAMGFKHTGLIQNLYNELRDSDNLQDAVEVLGLLVENIDQTAMRQRAYTANMLAEKFGKLTDYEDKALAEIGLETDLSVLYGTYTVDQIDDLVASDTELDKEIDKYIDKLKKLPGDNVPMFYKWYQSQAEGLGYYMVTGEADEIQCLNAYNIATGNMSGMFKIDATEEDIKTIDILATLYAIKFSDKANRSLYGTLNKAGKEIFYKTHLAYKRDTLEGILKGQDIHAIKGYTKYLGDNYVDIKIGTEDQEQEFKKNLYKKEIVLKDNPITGKKIAIYTSRLKTTQDYDKGAFSLFSVNRMGTSLMKTANIGEDLNVSRVSVEAMKANLDTLARIKVKKLIQLGKRDYKNKTGYTPVLNLDGEVLDYRIQMNNSLKKRLLGYDVSGIRALGNMQSTNIIKEHSKIVNKQTLDTMFKDMKQNYIPKQMKGKNNKFYTIVSPKSHDAKIREYYKILPEDIKREIERRGGKLAVREDLLLQYFGVRDMSMVDMPIIKSFTPWVKTFIKVAEETMKTIVPIYKASIILKTLNVPLGNIVSNIGMSVMYKTNIFKVLNMYRKNYKYLKDYIKTQKEILDIEQKVKINEATKNEVQSLNRKREELIHSPIAPLMEKGMYQMIVEDLSQSEQTSNNRLLKTIDKKTQFIPKFIKTGAKWVYLSEGTPVYDFMAKVTQMSDFVAKATEYQIRVKKGVDKNKALSDALRMVINYSRPSSNIENYVNKMGLWMFTKFAKRIQWVLFNGIRQNPVTAMLALFTQNVLFETENIGEQQFMLKNWSANWYTPIDIMEGALYQNHMEWVVDKVL